MESTPIARLIKAGSRLGFPSAPTRADRDGDPVPRSLTKYPNPNNLPLLRAYYTEFIIRNPKKVGSLGSR